MGRGEERRGVGVITVSQKNIPNPARDITEEISLSTRRAKLTDMCVQVYSLLILDVWYTILIRRGQGQPCAFPENYMGVTCGG